MARDVLRVARLAAELVEDAARDEDREQDRNDETRKRETEQCAQSHVVGLVSGCGVPLVLVDLIIAETADHVRPRLQRGRSLLIEHVGGRGIALQAEFRVLRDERLGRTP